ncbi:hypothetical protein [Sunxiuqinia indica]|nr:hypothetical protein [Sunxiuqinia indica]
MKPGIFIDASLGEFVKVIAHHRFWEREKKKKTETIDLRNLVNIKHKHI